jgi:hypothetical protein
MKKITTVNNSATIIEALLFLNRVRLHSFATAKTNTPYATHVTITNVSISIPSLPFSLLLLGCPAFFN